MPRQTVPELKQLSIWRQFEAAATPEQLAQVEKLVSIATQKLRQIRDTFPTYTLHDGEHADNVVHLMGELLGDRVSSLSAIEAAFLVLAAYFHDAGMAFSEEERARAREAPRFREFVDQHPAALVAVEKHSPGHDLPVDIAEWFFRWQHPQRVFDVLEQIAREENTLLLWGTQDVLSPLGHVCKSHNDDAAALQSDSLFPINFRYECDLRFCAVLLRLADILDFDRSRSPEPLYRDLGLKHQADRRGRTSDLEWRKHLAAEGFTFPRKRAPGYALGFVAGPDEPAVEHDIRQFLDTIESEFAKCASVIRSCSDRWRDHPLPGEVDLSNIKGKGYVYGEHRFILDQEQALNLFMGERLYSDPHVFVRELLQNALDTSRHREFHERASGNTTFAAKPISVDSWIDREGYRWVRFADQGMGMTERIINEFFLKVGRSYYRSPQFEADVIRYTKTTRQTFQPISRFGIGLLSCFIVGDRIEVSTRHAVADEAPLRLSLTGLHNFFVLQRSPNPLRPMPSPEGSESGKRDVPGTTVCVRLSPHRERAGFDLEKRFRTMSCVHLSPFWSGRSEPTREAWVCSLARGVSRPSSV